MAWRLVESLDALTDQIDAVAPGRSRASDGSIGDEDHQQTDSEHNPALIPSLGPVPVVRAKDITHDPAAGADMRIVSEALRVSRDRRVQYVIFDRRYFSPRTSWEWRPYTGSNPHTKHMHITAAIAHADDRSRWEIGLTMTYPDSARAADQQITWEVRPWTADTLGRVRQLAEALSAEDAETDATHAAVLEIRDLLAARPTIVLDEGQLSRLADMVAARLAPRPLSITLSGTAQ